MTTSASLHDQRDRCGNMSSAAGSGDRNHTKLRGEDPAQSAVQPVSISVPPDKAAIARTIVVALATRFRWLIITHRPAARLMGANGNRRLDCAGMLAVWGRSLNFHYRGGAGKRPESRRGE